MKTNNDGNAYQPKGPRIDPRKVFAAGQPASGVQPPYVGIRGHNYPLTGYLAMPCQQDAPAQADADDSTPAHLREAREHVTAALAHMELVQGDSRVDAMACAVALDALRDALTAIEAEEDSDNAQP